MLDAPVYELVVLSVAAEADPFHKVKVPVEVFVPTAHNTASSPNEVEEGALLKPTMQPSPTARPFALPKGTETIVLVVEVVFWYAPNVRAVWGYHADAFALPVSADPPLTVKDRTLELPVVVKFPFESTENWP